MKMYENNNKESLELEAQDRTKIYKYWLMAIPNMSLPQNSSWDEKSSHGT